MGVGWNNHTIALAVIGCKRSRAWGPALAAVRELREERGLSLNVVVYNSLLTVCETAGEWRGTCTRLDVHMN
jgi:8-oxo-dGTP pyrophosphatase MutT (NUDIX family)